MQTLDLAIGGMSCGHCVRSVQKALGHLDGVRVERVGLGEAALAYDPARTAPERILSAIADEGYTPQVRNG